MKAVRAAAQCCSLSKRPFSFSSFSLASSCPQNYLEDGGSPPNTLSKIRLKGVSPRPPPECLYYGEWSPNEEGFEGRPLPCTVGRDPALVPEGLCNLSKRRRDAAVVLTPPPSSG